MSAKYLLITGTDTEVGKSFVGAALVRAMVLSGLRVRAVKPVESGCGPGRLEPEDGVQLAHAARQAWPTAALTRLNTPVAPPLAAHLEGVELDFERWLETIKGLDDGQLDWIVVEGAGGLLSPLTWERSALDLAAELGACALVVAADRLGCLNHTLLTCAALKSRQVAIVGVILNASDAQDASVGSNLESLHRVAGSSSLFATSMPYVEGWEALVELMGPVLERLAAQDLEASP